MKPRWPRLVILRTFGDRLMRISLAIIAGVLVMLAWQIVTTKNDNADFAERNALLRERLALAQGQIKANDASIAALYKRTGELEHCIQTQCAIVPPEPSTTTTPRRKRTARPQSTTSTHPRTTSTTRPGTTTATTRPTATSRPCPTNTTPRAGTCITAPTAPGVP